MKVGVILGSLRKESFSRKIAETIVRLLPQNITAEILNIDFAMYNEDLDEGASPPKEWVDFRAKVKACDAYLFVTPEYNRSIPPVIKNALDVASRPYGQNSWAGKKGAVVTISAGPIGGFGANHVLRQSVVFLDIVMLQQPEMYIGNIASRFDEQGVLVKDTQEFLKVFADKYVKFIGA